MTRITLGNGATPRVAADAFVAPGAILAGNVELLAHSSVWYNAVLRAELDTIVIGERSNIQDSVSVHADDGFPVTLGSDVSVGHNAVVHGCTVGDRVLIGMNATVMNGAVIGDECLIAAGALVSQGTVIPPGSLVAGVPARVRRELTTAERDGLLQNATTYLSLAELHRAATTSSD